MFREHAPLIAVSAVIALLFYFVFRDLRSLHAGLDALAEQLLPAPDDAMDGVPSPPPATAMPVSSVATASATPAATATPAPPSSSEPPAAPTGRAAKRAV